MTNRSEQMAPLAQHLLVRLLLTSVLFVCGTLTAQAADDSAQRPPELKVLERLIGEWKLESHRRIAEWTPQESRTSGVVTREWVLDGRFIREEANVSDTDYLVMFTYDSEQKKYRWWLFNSEGHALETSGSWDESAKKLNFRADLGNGLTNTSSMHFIDDDTHKWKAVVKDRQGKIYFDGEGTFVRQKSR